MERLVEIIRDLQNDSSRTGKEAILKTNKDNDLFRYVLNFVYNPFIVTGLSTKKINKKVKFGIEEIRYSNHNFTRIDEVLRYLKTNNSGRDYDIAVMQNFINKLPEDQQDVVKQIITKDLKVGLTEKTINKVYGKGTIESFAVMLAESYAKKEAKVKGKFFITLKLDGNRCVAIKEDDAVKFFTRKGQAIEGMKDLEKEFMKFPNGYAFDGEVLLKNTDNLPSDELFRATQKVVRKDGVKKDLEFHMFDVIPLKEFKEGKSKNTYENRRGKLEALFSMIESDLIHKLPVLYEGTDKNMIGVLMKWAEEKNYEGLMINTADGLYQTKRTDALLKVKKFQTADLLVVSLEKAIDGQFKGMLSRVNVEYKGSLVGCGSGFSVDQRQYFVENPDEIIGRIIEVQYFEESKDEKTGEPSLRFPVFKGIRHDKTIEDISYS
ncbi:DNA ligase [Bacillus phage vB_BcoS-136]|uniref:DNA ligase n=1 Tax=Bacillus phage vB_BcoS-136 TaxID=2419619 RepID=A0A3G3BVY0_9CAUD|nr:DNA ligase [Bacillus phage vB_BcoS-136]AYP68300.1 DNA ligase [Bacillus phage vB_BcoS-136]